MLKDKGLLKNLYEMASSENEQGLSVFDEQKLRKELEKNTNFMKSNKEIFSKGEKKFTTCSMYSRCPICEKCKVKASHLYVRCQNCKIPICVHTHKNISQMILRKNFIVKLKREDFKAAFRSLKKK